MQFVPNPNSIVVSINKVKQKEKKEKIGSLYVVTNEKDESRNMQQGEVVGFGSNLNHLFPQAKIGHTAILHWLVESRQRSYKIFEDENNNYYQVTACEFNGRANELYGVWDGEKIIPNPEYIFLEKEKDTRELKESESGILLYENWTETRKDKEDKMATINAEIQSLTKTKMSNQLAGGIREKEAELAKISNDINKQRIQFYKVAAINPDVAEEIENCFGHEFKIGDKVGFLNLATQTTVEFMGTEYIVALCNHLKCSEKWAKDAVTSHKKAAVETAAVL